MPKQMVEIEVPNGYKAVDYRMPKDGEYVLINGKTAPREGRRGEYPILKKIRVSLHQFYFDSITLTRKNGWRYGKGMFNHLVKVKPELAEKIRGTDCDPFQCESPTDPAFDRFVEFIESNWEH